MMSRSTMPWCRQRSTATWPCVHDLGRDEKPRLHDGSWPPSVPSELKKQGILKNLDESEEINACTVKIKVRCERQG